MNICLQSFLMLLLSISCFAQPIPVPNALEQQCQWPPATKTVTSYRLLLIEGEGLENKVKKTEGLSKQAFSLLDRTYIRSGKAFKKYFGYKTKDVNWKKEKVLLVSTSKTYKFGSPESESKFMGIAQIDSILYIGYKNIQIGPCQGVMVPDEAYSAEFSYQLAILPKTAADSFQFIYCYEGPDCSEIP